MESKAIPLILFERDGYQVTAQGLSFLQSVEGKVGVVAVVGKYRTGKSFLLNRVLLEHREGLGFGVGPTINPCTKGIWVWSEVLHTVNSEGESLSVIVLDSEGLGAFDEDASHDSRIFLLSLLLSSYFIYNSVGSIDESALQTLSLVVNLSKQLQVRLGPGPADPEEIASYFPSFLWVLRDFALQLADPQGNAITSRQYLEGALTAQRGLSDSIEAKNRIRRVLTSFFKDRECFAMVRPTESELELQKLDEAPDEIFRAEFLAQAAKLRKLVFRKVKAKTLNGEFLTGRMLGELAVAYTTAINQGSVPNIEGAWTSVCHGECQKALEGSVGAFESTLRTLQLPMTEAELASALKEAEDAANSLLRENLMGDDTVVWVSHLAEGISAKARAFIEKNTKLSVSAVQRAVDEWWATALSALKSSEYSEFYTFHGDLESFCKSTRASCTNKSSELCLLEFQAMACAEGAEYILRGTRSQQEGENRRLVQQLETLQAQLTRKRDDFSTEKKLLRDRLSEQDKELSSLRALEATGRLRTEEFAREKQRIEDSCNERVNYLRETSLEQLEELKKLNAGASQKVSQLQAQLAAASNSQESALLKQELSFKKEEIAHLQTRNAALEKKLKKQEQNESARPREPPEDWSAEKQLLLEQLASLRAQLGDHKSVQESLMSALNSRPVESPVPHETNRHLSYALSKVEERCEGLEDKLRKLRALKRTVQAASGLRCKRCLAVYELPEFLVHHSACTHRHIDENAPLTLSVTHTLVKEQERLCTEYAISVAHKDECWTVNRRYKMFCSLHSSLLHQFPHIALPQCTALFSPNPLQSKRPVVLEERRQGIQQYLTRLTRVPVFRDCTTLRQFLGVD